MFILPFELSNLKSSLAIKKEKQRSYSSLAIIRIKTSFSEYTSRLAKTPRLAKKMSSHLELSDVPPSSGCLMNEMNEDHHVDNNNLQDNNFQNNLPEFEEVDVQRPRMFFVMMAFMSVVLIVLVTIFATLAVSHDYDFALASTIMIHGVTGYGLTGHGLTGHGLTGSTSPTVLSGGMNNKMRLFGGISDFSPCTDAGIICPAWKPNLKLGVMCKKAPEKGFMQKPGKEFTEALQAKLGGPICAIDICCSSTEMGGEGGGNKDDVVGRFYVIAFSEDFIWGSLLRWGGIFLILFGREGGGIGERERGWRDDGLFFGGREDKRTKILFLSQKPSPHIKK